MRPVNLIPVEQRRRQGGRSQMRGGPLAYILIGALIAALAGVTLLVTTDNQISNRKAEVAQLKREDAATKARIARLDAYAQFHDVLKQRVATVTELADSRFDWERVMRELALVLPNDVWLTNLTATADPSVAPAGAASVSLRGSIPGPALELVGCARGQEAVAGFIQALKEIGGVTRVGVQSSVLGSESGGSANSGSASSASGEGASCQTHHFIAGFQIVAAFDAAPVPSEATGSSAVTTPSASTTATTNSSSSSTPSSASSSSESSSTTTSSESEQGNG